MADLIVSGTILALAAIAAIAGLMAAAAAAAYAAGWGWHRGRRRALATAAHERRGWEVERPAPITPDDGPAAPARATAAAARGRRDQPEPV